MTAQSAALTELPPCEIGIHEEFGWHCHCAGDVIVWLKGDVGVDGKALARQLAVPKVSPSPDTFARLLLDADGHFALVARGAGWAVAAVDWVRSTPLAATRISGRWCIDDQPERLRRRAGLGPADIDPDAALCVAMAGYTIDTGALYRGMELLTPGELMWFEGNDATRHRDYIYRPWRVRDADPGALEGDLADCTLEIMKRTIDSLGGRTMLVPLSAGRDSRLVVSAAKHLGYTNVKCFAYGRAGNFEASASKAIAERLGFPWAFVPATIAGQHRFFESGDYARYLDFSDSGCSVPFVQDMAPLMELKRNGYVPDDAVIVNGNSGDYISGNHIPPHLRKAPVGLSEDARWARILDALIGKHFSLWETLVTPRRRDRIAGLLRASIARAGGALGEPDTDHGLYEYAEFQDRQCRYVITGQRTYEYLGHEWRLPLWDNAYLRFWEGVPLAAKAGQGLYARMLASANWSGVWRDVPVNRKTIRPRWIVPLRLAAKIAHAPLGPERWHDFERRFFQYWMEATCNSASVPYGRVWRDNRGARNHIARFAESYLARHGVSFSGLAD